MTQENRGHNLRREWSLSESAWTEAEILLRANQPRGAVTRYYYSAFHAACAALLSEGIETTTHTGVRNQFALHFLKKQRLSVTLGRNLASLQQQREDADYERELQIDHTQAEWARDEAAEVRAEIEKWLKAQGWLPDL